MRTDEINPAIQPTSFASSEPENPFDFGRVFDVAYRRRWIALLTFCLVLVLGVMYTLSKRSIYQSEVTMVVATSETYSQAGDLSLIADLQALTRSKSIETQIGILESSDLREAALEKLQPEAMRKQALGAAVASKKESDLITVTASAYDPEVAKEFASAIAEAYQERDKEASSQATKQAREYVEQELKSVRQGLRDANESLAAYKRKTGLFTIDEQVAQATKQVADLEADADRGSVELGSVEKQVEFYKNKLSAQGDLVLSSTTFQQNPLFQAELESIRKLQEKRAQLIQEYEPTDRTVKKVEAEIAEAEMRLRGVGRTIAASKTQVRNPTADQYIASLASYEVARARKQVMDTLMNKRRNSLDDLPEQQRGLAEQLQDVRARERAFEALSDRYYALLVSEKSVLPTAMIISEPRVPRVPSYPNKKRNYVLFGLLGLLAAVAVAYAAESIDTKVRDETSVAHLTGSVALSAIPNVDAEPGTRLMIGELEHNSAFLEAFRILRNNISFTTIDRPLKLLAVTSPGRSEGKSTTSVNLAIAMAMDGKRVLIVDADLRRPSIHRWMKVSRDIGFTTLVKGQTNVETAVVASETENVFVLPSGPLPPNPTEFLNSQHCRNTLSQLAELYDIVILDCPPCAGLSDMQVISTAVDAVLLVVSMNVTLRPNLYITMHTLRQVDAPLIGFVLNRLDIKRRGYGYYYSYYYYYYDYDEDTASKQGGKKGGRKSRRH